MMPGTQPLTLSPLDYLTLVWFVLVFYSSLVWVLYILSPLYCLILLTHQYGEWILCPVEIGKFNVGKK